MQYVQIVEVAPRDGLQNEAVTLATAEKAELVRLLASSGVIPMHKWYRISEADEDPVGPVTINNNQYYQRDVTLIGPDWDLQNVLPFANGAPQGDYDMNNNPIPDNVEVTIVPGVVTVFDRTVQLEFDGTGY